MLLASGLGAACAIISREGKTQRNHMAAMRDTLLEEIQTQIRELCPSQRILVNGHTTHRLPNTLSLGFEGIAANVLLKKVRPYVSASAAAACHSGEVKISSVLKAIGVPALFAMGTVRLSVGISTTKAQCHLCAGYLVKALVELRCDN